MSILNSTVASIIFLLFALPLIVWPIGVSFYEIPKIIVGITIIYLSILFTVIYHIVKNTKISLSIPHKIISLILISLTLYSLIILYTSEMFWGSIFRSQGIFLLWLLLGFSIVSSQFKITKSYFYAAILSFIILSITTFVMPSTLIGRNVGLLGEPNALASVILFIWVWGYFYFKNKQSYYWIPLFLSSLFVILSTRSRSGLVGFILQTLFLILIHKCNFSLKKSTIICTILLLLSTFAPFFEKNRLFENRWEIWQTAFHSGAQKPILGNGFGNIEQSLLSSSKSLSNNIRFQKVDSSHNFILDWWVQGGIIGVGLQIYTFFVIITNFIKHRSQLEIALLMGVTTALFFNPASIVTLVHLWWLWGRGLQNTKENNAI